MSNAHTIWKGAINFGLVNIQVKLSAATQENNIRFHQAHVHEEGAPGAIKYKKVCEGCGVEVPTADIAKTYETGDGVVVLTKEDFDSLPLNSLKTIEVQEFVPLDKVPAILFEKHYALTPEQTGLKAYSLLVQALEKSGKAGVVKVTLRQREQVAMLAVRDGCLALTTLRWVDEVREMPEVVRAEVSEAELDMAVMLIESQSHENFDPTAYEDGYEKALASVIETKRASAIPALAGSSSSGADVVDLMAMLTASVEANKRKAELPEHKPALALVQ